MTEGVAGDSLCHNMRVGRSLLFMLTGALMTAACGGAGLAPVVERSTAGTGSGQAAGISGGTAGGEVSDGGWTATVRPLGDPGSTASRKLPTTAGMQEVGQRREQLPSEEPVAAAAPASSGGGQAPVPASSGAARPAAPAPGAALPPASLQSSAAAPGAALPPASLQSSAAAPGAALPPASLQSSAAANPAVVSLLNTANAQSRAGDHARAAATLERAIAIEPDNAWLWHRLAGARLAEGRLSQAASLAAKSNSLANSPATTDRSLQADNWKLIAEVRRRQGDTGAAAAAESQAARLSN